jgi:integrase
LDVGRRIGFHAIRRSAASHYAAAGGDAVEMLDHSSPSITKRWYLDPRLADRGSRPCDVLPAIAVGR